ncbi:MAG: diphthine--ammonia ligase [Candidatus Diapherotrites archaeon]|nr:diphthine--ammonia ligase [Candidatus Diapherotrites archaeon]
MKICGLFSGGKDSTYALFKAIQAGHEIVCLLTIRAERDDSYMYQVSNIELTELGAEAMDLPLVVEYSTGIKELELSELRTALTELKSKLGLEGVSTGAIASRYQADRIQKICDDLGLKTFNPHWQRNHEELLREMLAHDFKIMIHAVAAQGLDNDLWLGRILDNQAVEELIQLNKKFGVSLIGEGGEFESLVLDCPLFKKKIEIVEAVKEWKGLRGIYKIKKAILVEK